MTTNKKNNEPGFKTWYAFGIPRKNKFDCSDYTENSQFYDKSNKKVIGKFKDEASGIPITEFIGLRSKMHSYIKDNYQNNKTAKGIKKL